MKKHVFLWSMLLFAILMMNGCSNSQNQKDDLHKIMQNGKWGFADQKDRIVIEPTFEEVAFFSEGLAAVRVGDKWGFIDKTGNFVINPKYDFFNDFSEGLAPVEINDKWGFVDKTGNVIIQPKYDAVRRFHDGLSYVKSNDEWFVIEMTGKIVGRINPDCFTSISKMDSIERRILDSLSRK